jgi:hypothetical protein
VFATPPLNESARRGPESDDGRAVVLGRYRLLERLGAGGFGVVWRAYDEQLLREVAVKQIHLPGADAHDRAAREAQASARLAHPSIVALYEARADRETFYLISELVHGETLAVLIHERRLSDEQTLQIALALCEALAHAHERGVIHRDVKPQNVLVPEPRDGCGQAAKLTDFGGARLAGEDALTRTGDVLGTLAYMAPEQSEGRAVSPATDLYSLALVVYEALCGANPVRGRTPAATVRRIGRALPPLEHRRGDLPRELTRAIDRALAPEPARRGTLEELREALSGGLERGWRRRARPPVAHATHAAHESGSEPETGRLRLPRGLWLAAAAGVAIWQAAAARPGVALLALAAALPLLLPRRLAPGALAAALAPALGLAGLAGVFPALAGQATRWRARAAVAALGYWWLCLAEPLLGRHLWLGAPAGADGAPIQIAAWGGSPTAAATHVLAPLLSGGVLLGAALWALAAALLPWLVRGRSAALDLIAAGAWSAALLTAAPLLDHGLPIAPGAPQPRGAVLAAILAAALAVAARGVRGPV